MLTCIKLLLNFTPKCSQCVGMTVTILICKALCGTAAVCTVENLRTENKAASCLDSFWYAAKIICVVSRLPCN